MSLTIELAPAEMEQIRKARDAHKAWMVADIDTPACEKALARWERLKAELAFLLMEKAEDQQ
ncbi:hypothetical protein [Pseudomonas sp. PL-6]